MFASYTEIKNCRGQSNNRSMGQKCDIAFSRKARFHEPRTINETKRTKKNRRKENDLYVEQKKKNK